MTRDEIIRMAREIWSSGGLYIGHSESSLERFAALVAAKERDACALIVEREASQYTEPVWAVEIVNDIRDRGKRMKETKHTPGPLAADSHEHDEPVAYGIKASNTGRICQFFSADDEGAVDELGQYRKGSVVPLYTHPYRLAQAVADEREACAIVCDEYAYADEAAEAIRARGMK